MYGSHDLERAVELVKSNCSGPPVVCVTVRLANYVNGPLSVGLVQLLKIDSTAPEYSPPGGMCLSVWRWICFVTVTAADVVGERPGDRR